MIFLVRHAHAGSSASWHGPDDQRPLTDRGQLQAKRIAEALLAEGARSVVSSPYLRCVQTVSPLAAMIGGEVEESPDLAEGAGGERAARMVANAAAGTVFCSHGDVLHELVGYLAAMGAPVRTALQFEKGAVLRLDRDGTRIVSVQYHPPER